MEGSCSLPTSSGTFVHDQSNPERLNDVLECKICLGPLVDPVATSCGHVFCWPCLYRWLENQPKPCPVCRNILRRDINILPLFGSHEVCSGDGAAWATNGRAAVPSEGASDSVMIPPRPSIPSLFNGIGVIPRGANIPPMISAHGMEGIVNYEGFLTLNQLVEMCERDHRRAVRQVLQERGRVEYLRTQRDLMRHDLCVSEGRISALVGEAQERDERHRQEIRQREHRHSAERNRLRRHMARLERQLARENWQLARRANRQRNGA